jgi:hypothetical protein
MRKTLKQEDLPVALNVDEREIIENVRRNIRRHLPQVQPFAPQEGTILLVCGGPSLKDFEEEIKEKQKEGCKVATVNGTHNWCWERDITVGAHVMVDSRAFNARFVDPPHKETRYLIASQCHPSVFDILVDNDVWIWHGISVPEEIPILNRQYFGHYFHIQGGSTVALRALNLLKVLGFRRFEVYGMDSCFSKDGEHHAYKQEENKELEQEILDVVVAGRTFKCTAWMQSQAKEFIDQSKMLGQDIELIVHGDGLIAHLIKAGSKASEDLKASAA